MQIICFNYMMRFLQKFHKTLCKKWYISKKCAEIWNIQTGDVSKIIKLRGFRIDRRSDYKGTERG